MKAYFKTVIKTFTGHFSRFIALVLIILIGISFVTGVGGITPKVENSINEYLTLQNVPDIILKSKKDTGFTSDERQEIDDLSFIKETEILTCFDTKIDDEESRIYSYPFDSDINNLKLLEGEFPDSYDEIAVEQESSKILKRNIGETVTYSGIEFKITGIVSNPLLFSKQGEQSMNNEDESLSLILYLNKDKSILPLPNTDIYVVLDKKKSSNRYSKEYQDYVSSKIKVIQEKENFKEENVASLSLEENQSFAISENVGNKVNVIAALFPAFFITVVALVVLTTMTRLIDEDRKLIACYRSLGYSKHKIRLKYVLFALISSIIGIAGGLLLGSYVIPSVIYPAFSNVFFLPSVTSSMNFFIGVISSIAMFVSTVLVTVIVISKSLTETPATLLLPKAPKAGKVILLEKAGFIWKRLKFKYKSAIRNIFRYKGRLWMIVLSVMGSTALVMAGFCIYDSSSSVLEIDGIKVDLTSTLQPISLLVIIFAMLLSILVLYNLTNMNIGEREREIATLKVLGYHDLEVDAYIFREILVMSLFGIILGIPLGTGLLVFIFNYLEFGGIENVHWYSYIYILSFWHYCSLPSSIFSLFLKSKRSI